MMNHRELTQYIGKTDAELDKIEEEIKKSWGEAGAPQYGDPRLVAVVHARSYTDAADERARRWLWG